MKRITTSLIALAMGTILAWSGITLGVPVQLLNGQSSQLPDKNIETTHKQVKYTDKAPAAIKNALDSLIGIVTENAGTCRTFAVRISGDCTQFNITSLDPLEPMEAGDEVMGTMIADRFHFLVMRNASNKDAMNTLFKTAGDKIKYVREFEFVEEWMDPIITCIEATLTDGNLKMTTCIVDGMEIE